MHFHHQPRGPEPIDDAALSDHEPIILACCSNDEKRRRESHLKTWSRPTCTRRRIEVSAPLLHRKHPVKDKFECTVDPLDSWCVLYGTSVQANLHYC